MKDPAVFNRDSSNYDKMRPSYPTKLFEDMKKLTDIPNGGRILEIGCGTGQATLPLLSDGYCMTCLDIGGSLLERAKSNAEGYQNARFILSSFEDWIPDEESFDVVMSATAFHWVKPEIGYKKAAQALKDSGGIALFWNKHPPSNNGFFTEVQSVYREVVPEWGEPSMQTIDEWIVEQVGLIEDSGCFRDVAVNRYPWSVPYTTEEYLKLLDTYSDHGNLEQARKKRLYEGIAECINEKYSGVVQRPYLSVLFTARKSN